MIAFLYIYMFTLVKGSEINGVEQSENYDTIWANNHCLRRTEYH